MDEVRVLEGTRVLDVGSFVFGPAAATVMSDFGAEVIKVEPPGIGDPYRYLSQMPPLPECDQDYCWMLDSRNKKSVALDLKDREAHEILVSLVRSCDVFLTNYPQRVLEGLRLRFEDLSEENPRLVYAHATGFGARGAEAGKPGYDATAWWARSGLQDIVRPAGSDPGLSAPGMGDHPSAMALFGAIMLALYQRERSGRGSKVSSSLLANGAWANAIYIQAMLCGARGFEHVSHHAPANAVVNQYATRDGRWILLALVQEDKLWPGLCAALERPDLAEDARFRTKPERRTHAHELCAILEQDFASRDFAEWRKRLDAHDITFGHAACLEELPDDPQMQANDVFVQMESGGSRVVTSPIEMQGQAKVTPRPAPGIGEHTHEILASLGYDDARIQALRERGAIR